MRGNVGADANGKIYRLGFGIYRHGVDCYRREWNEPNDRTSNCVEKSGGGIQGGNGSLYAEYGTGTGRIRPKKNYSYRIPCKERRVLRYD